MPGTHTLERYRSQMLIQWRSFTVDVDLDFRPGDRGVLVAHGDQGGGYSLSVDGDRLSFVHNDSGQMDVLDLGPLTAGRHEVVLETTARRAAARRRARARLRGGARCRPRSW